jgi:hypothetical protein
MDGKKGNVLKILQLNKFRKNKVSFMTHHGFVTKLTRSVSLVEQELHTLPEHLSSPPVFSGVRVTRSLVFYLDVMTST